jgi:hypothetical protein
VEAGTFDARVDRHLSYVSLNLDAPAWKQASTLLDATLERLSELELESETRQAGERIRATFGLLGFESPGEAD